MIGMQTTLDRILATVSGGSQPSPLTYPPVLPHGHVAQPSPGVEFGQRSLSPRPQFPPLPGFAAPVGGNPPPLQTLRLYDPSHTNMPHMASSQATRHRMTKMIQKMLFRDLRLVPRSKHFKVSRMPRWKLPIHQNSRQGVLVSTLQALPDCFNYNRVRKRKRAEPIPRNAFPHVVEKVRNTLHLSSPVDWSYAYRVWSPKQKLGNSTTCLHSIHIHSPRN